MWKTAARSPNGSETLNGKTECENESADKTYLEKVIQGVSSFIVVNTKLFDWSCCFFEMQLFKVVSILGFVMSINEVGYV